MIFFYATNFLNLFERWSSDAGWSHGFVVPLIALFFIRLKWDKLRALEPTGSMWGLVVLLIGGGGQVLFRATGLEHMSCLSIPVVLFGVVLFVFGWEYMKVLWLPISYLVFALPPPQALYVQITMPMQKIAAELGVQLLPLFGGYGVRNGTVIDVIFSTGRIPLQVEQACSGMRSLVAFFALAVALGYSSDRPVWQKVTLAFFALPIAILCNGIRVAMTGVLAIKVSPDWAKGDAHGFFGLAMLIPAMLMQMGVAWILDRLFIETPDENPQAGAA
ncbi:MAG TPA: exosortase/archaeosortase family protein [Phycisphaerae bacterium]